MKFENLDNTSTGKYRRDEDQLIYTTTNDQKIILPYTSKLINMDDTSLTFEIEEVKGCIIKFEITSITPDDNLTKGTIYSSKKEIGKSKGTEVILTVKKGGTRLNANEFVVGTADPCKSSTSNSGESKEDPMSRKKKTREDLGLLDPYYVAAVTSPMGALSGALSGLKGGLNVLKNFNKKESFERSSDQKLVEEVDRIKQLLK